MNKKRIIITAAVGLVSFGGAFVVSWLTAPAPEQTELDSSNTPTLVARGGGLGFSSTELPAIRSGVAKETITERQLKDLVYDVREKMQEYNSKLESLEVRETRIKTAHAVIKEDIMELSNLRIDLASTVAAIKEEQAKLNARLVEIGNVEKNNLITIAATYDKMDAATAGKILKDMTKMKGSSGTEGFEDAVKILHYMKERSRGKLLVELASTESKLAATFCRKLKRIVEQ